MFHGRAKNSIYQTYRNHGFKTESIIENLFLDSRHVYHDKKATNYLLLNLEFLSTEFFRCTPTMKFDSLSLALFSVLFPQEVQKLNY